MTITAAHIEAAYAQGENGNLVLDNGNIRVIAAADATPEMVVLAPANVLYEIGEYARDYAEVARELNNDPYAGTYTL